MAIDAVGVDANLGGGFADFGGFAGIMGGMGGMDGAMLPGIAGDPFSSAKGVEAGAILAPGGVGTAFPSAESLGLGAAGGAAAAGIGEAVVPTGTNKGTGTVGADAAAVPGAAGGAFDSKAGGASAPADAAKAGDAKVPGANKDISGKEVTKPGDLPKATFTETKNPDEAQLKIGKEFGEKGYAFETDKAKLEAAMANGGLKYYKAADATDAQMKTAVTAFQNHLQTNKIAKLDTGKLDARQRPNNSDVKPPNEGGNANGGGGGGGNPGPHRI